MDTNLLRYHPLRYKYYLRDLFLRTYKRFHQYDNDPLLYNSPEIAPLLVEECFNSEVEDLLVRNGMAIDKIEISDYAQWKGELFDAADSYFSNGENIFHILPDLALMFTNTSVAEIRYKDLKLPYEYLYLHFGHIPGLETTEFYIDGAYIEGSTNDSEELELFIYLTTSALIDRTTSPPTPYDFIVTEPHYFFVMPNDLPSGTVNEALLYEESERRTGADGFRFRFSHSIFAPIFNSAINLVINSLCYLGSEHDDTEKQFPPSTPKSILNKIKYASTRKQRERALSKARSQGYRKIYFVGRTYECATVQQGGKDALATHWRRGHWRQQAHGEQLSKGSDYKSGGKSPQNLISY